MLMNPIPQMRTLRLKESKQTLSCGLEALALDL